jgi:RNA polymerase sigma-70 factor, ECF subfamily
VLFHGHADSSGRCCAGWRRTSRACGPPGLEASGLLADLDDALRRLEQLEPRQSRVVACRFFGGLSVQETAAALGISARTVERDWAVAQAWLHRELAG